MGSHAAAPISALVTGGNRGIGLEIVKLILQNAPGSHVFLGCRDLTAGQGVAASLGGGTVTAVQLDVTSTHSIQDAVALVSKHAPYLDLLVNNAGILHEDFRFETARETLLVNFEGVVAVTCAFLPMLCAKPGGGASILSTSSGVGARTLGLINEEH